MRFPRFHTGGRWQVALRAIPFVALAAGGRLLVELLGWDTLEINPLFTGLLAANVFVLGFLLAGTLSDYKESERLPSELAASLESIADECQILSQDKGAPVARDCLLHIGNLGRTIRGWLMREATTSDVLDEVSGLNGYFLAFEPLTQPNFIVRLKQEQAATRRMILRIQTIRDTSFVGAGYAIAELASTFLVGGLLFVAIGSVGEALFFVCVITFLLAYMILLIKDLDDPFDYGEAEAGEGEVSLHALENLEKGINSKRELAEDVVLSAPKSR